MRKSKLSHLACIENQKSNEQAKTWSNENGRMRLLPLFFEPSGGRSCAPDSILKVPKSSSKISSFELPRREPRSEVNLDTRADRYRSTSPVKSFRETLAKGIVHVQARIDWHVQTAPSGNDRNPLTLYRSAKV